MIGPALIAKPIMKMSNAKMAKFRHFCVAHLHYWFCHERRPDHLGALLGNLPTCGPRSRSDIQHRNKLDRQRHCGYDVPFAPRRARQRQYVSPLWRAEHTLHHILRALRSGDKGCVAGEDRGESSDGSALEADWAADRSLDS